MSHTEEVPVDLNSDIKLIKDLAEALVQKDEKFVPGVDIVKLAYQGKILEEGLKVGNYTKEDAIFQIFKLRKNV